MFIKVKQDTETEAEWRQLCIGYLLHHANSKGIKVLDEFIHTAEGRDDETYWAVFHPTTATLEVALESYERCREVGKVTPEIVALSKV